MSRTATKGGKRGKRPAAKDLTVRLDAAGKKLLAEAARLRGISPGDYMRMATLGQARREVEAAHQQSIALTPDEQLAFWAALQAPVELTESQKRLAALMRGDS